MKNSRLRRTLAVFLSAMLLMLCMPMTALTVSAVEVIDAVTVNVDTTALPTELVAGEEPNTSSVINAFSVPVDANYSISDYVIADINIENYTSYVAGTDYYMWLLIAPDTGYSFDANVTASSADGKLINWGLNYEDNLIVGYPLGTVAGGSSDSNVITAVTVNVDTTALPTELVAGEEPNISSVINAFSIPFDANYSIYDCLIADENIGNYNSYVAGTDYYMWLLIAPDTGYSFDANVTASSADGNLIIWGLNYEGNLIVGYPLGTVAGSPTDNDAPEGYTTDANKIMAYRYKYGCFDIQGKFNGNWRPTTYANEGYFTKVKVGDDVYGVSAAPFASAEALENGLKVGIDLEFVNNGKQLKIVYTVENTGAEAINYALASGADVQIGSDDGAVITPFSDAKGFKMVSQLDHYTKPDGTEDYAQFNFFGDSKYSGVTGVSALWYGYYNHVYDNDVLFGYGEADCQTAADGEYLDSGMIWRWDNNTIGAGETKTFSILIGIGGAGSENIVPSDPQEPEGSVDDPIEEPVEEEKAPVYLATNSPECGSAFNLVLTNNTEDTDHNGTLTSFAKRIKKAPKGTEFFIDAGNTELIFKTSFMNSLISSGNCLIVKTGDLTFVIDSKNFEKVKVINLPMIKRSEECKELAKTTKIIYISVDNKGKITLSAEKPE